MDKLNRSKLSILIVLYFLSAYTFASASDVKTLKFPEALERAEAIFLGQIERVEVIKPDIPDQFNRRSLFRVQKWFKGGTGKKSVYIYFKHVEGAETTENSPPTGLDKTGDQFVVYVENKSQWSTSYLFRTFNFVFSPKWPEFIPRSSLCEYNALCAYKNKKPLDEVIQISKCKHALSSVRE